MTSLNGADPIPPAKFAPEPAFHDDFDAGWETAQKSWKVATWRQNETQMSPERCKTDGQGMLVQTVKSGDPPLGGSLQTDREFGFGRWVARVKPSNVPGALHSIFTKDWDDLKQPGTKGLGNKGEVDIEFLTSTFGPGKGEVHLAIHLQIDGKMVVEEWDIPLDFNPSDAFHEWSFEILPQGVIWYVDGRELHRWHATAQRKIDPVYEMFFNSWTSPKWIKGPPAADAVYHIDWVKFYPLLEQ